MKSIYFIELAILFAVSAVYPQDSYKINYKFSEKDNTNAKNFTLEKSGNNYKFNGIDKYGNDVTMYINKDERKIYTVTKNSTVTLGTRHNGIECSYAGMQWGVYLLDMDQCEFLIQSSTESGSAVVAGKNCTIYNAMQQGDLRTDYYIYNNQVSLKMSSPATTIEAVSIDESPVFTADEFTPPAIEWMDQ